MKFLGYPSEVLETGDVSDETRKGLLARSSLDWYRRYFTRLRSGTGRHLIGLHEDDDVLGPQSYLSATPSGLGVSVMVRLRTGALRTRSRISRFTDITPACPCPDCDCAEETPAHFLAKCPGYAQYRVDWLRDLNGSLHEPLLSLPGGGTVI